MKDAEESIKSLKKIARIAGILYFLTAITTIFGLLYVRSELIVYGDATATAENITANEFLFRSGIAVNLICQVLQLFLGLALYNLFKGVNKSLALVMLFSKLISLTIAVVGTLGNFAALLLLSKADYLKAFTPEQTNALMMLFLKLTNEALGLLEIFWFPHLFALGLLIIKSKFIPKILGILLIIGGFGFVVNVFIKLLAPDFYPALVTQITMLLGSSGGIPIIFWLLIKGVKSQESK